MSDCSNVKSYDNEPPIRGRIEFADGTDWPIALMRHGRVVSGVEIDGELYEKRGCDYERGYADGRRAEAIERGSCATCGHSRYELHSGDAELVCWVRRSHGEKVEPDHYCGKRVER